MKRVLALILTFTLILSCISGALAENAPEGDSSPAAEVSSEGTETAEEVPAEEESTASGENPVESEDEGKKNPNSEMSENLKIVSALLNSEDFRHLLEIDDVKFLISDILAESVIWMLQNRPVTMKILAELGAAENDLKVINRLWDSETVIEHSVVDYLDEPDGQLLQEQANQLFGSSDFLQTVKDFTSLATSEDLQNLIQAFVDYDPEAESETETAEAAEAEAPERAGEEFSEADGTEAPENVDERAGEGTGEAADTEMPETTGERAGEGTGEAADTKAEENTGEAADTKTEENTVEATETEAPETTGGETGETAEAETEESAGETTEAENDPFLKELAERKGLNPKDERFIRVARLYKIILHSDWAQHSLPTLLKNELVWDFTVHLLSLVEEPKLQPAREELRQLSQDKDLLNYIISFFRSNVEPYLNLLMNDASEDTGTTEANIPEDSVSEESVPETSETEQP